MNVMTNENLNTMELNVSFAREENYSKVHPRVKIPV
jgi:hypothetical protein